MIEPEQTRNSRNELSSQNSKREVPLENLQTQSSRWLFVDLFRFCAVVLMIQGHSFDALLDLSYRSSSWFSYHSFWHGFTAPMFMFASGIAFGIATLRKWKSHTVWGKLSRDRFARYGSLLLIGYFLHLPYFSWKKISELGSSQLYDQIFSFDALQVIGVSLFLLQLLVLILKRRRSVMLVVGICIPLLLFLSPLIWHGNYSQYWPIFRTAMSSSTGSQFPFFPWSVYLFTGFLAGYFLRPELSRRPPVHRLRILASFGLLFIVIAGAISVVDGDPVENSGLTINESVKVFGLGKGYFASMSWNVNPLVIIFKTGFLLGFLALLFIFEFGLKASRISSMSWIQRSANQTLAIYVVHLMILYGSPLNIGLRYVIGANQMSLALTILFTIIFTAMMVFFGLSWDWVRKNKSIPDRRIKIIVSLILFYFFMTRPF